MDKTTNKKADNYKNGRSDYKASSFCILLAEDDEEMRSLLALVLRKEGYLVTECPDGMSLLEQLSPFFLPGQEENIFDLIISDIKMPGVTGMEILMGANERGDFPPIILITAFGDRKTHDQAERLGAVALFDKPFDINDLLDKVRTIL